MTSVGLRILVLVVESTTSTRRSCDVSCARVPQASGFDSTYVRRFIEIYLATLVHDMGQATCIRQSVYTKSFFAHRRQSCPQEACARGTRNVFTHDSSSDDIVYESELLSMGPAVAFTSCLKENRSALLGLVQVSAALAMDPTFAMVSHVTSICCPSMKRMRKFESHGFDGLRQRLHALGAFCRSSLFPNICAVPSSIQVSRKPEKNK